jgi:hypothetical protein
MVRVVCRCLTRCWAWLANLQVDTFDTHQHLLLLLLLLPPCAAAPAVATHTCCCVRCLSQPKMALVVCRCLIRCWAWLGALLTCSTCRSNAWSTGGQEVTKVT